MPRRLPNEVDPRIKATVISTMYGMNRVKIIQQQSYSKKNNNMDKRKLGQLEVSPIGMGCMGFSHGYGQVPPEAYAIEAIRKAYDYGCTHFDTAEAYGKEQFYAGHNEELVGKAVEPFRKEVVLATKFHIGELPKPDGTNLYREVRRHLEDSMSRLRTDYIDLYYLHRINEMVRLEDVALSLIHI